MIPMRTLHHLMATISIGIILSNCDSFDLHERIFMLKILTRDQGRKKFNGDDESDELPICSFD